MKIFNHCFDCGIPLSTTILRNKFRDMIDERYYINNNLFCKNCFIQYIYRYSSKKGLSQYDIHFIIKEQKFYYD